jgi:hypothetical protein
MAAKRGGMVESKAPVRRRRLGAPELMLWRRRVFAKLREGFTYEEIEADGDFEGADLVGSPDFMEEARRLRRLLGEAETKSRFFTPNGRNPLKRLIPKK